MGIHARMERVELADVRIGDRQEGWGAAQFRVHSKVLGYVSELRPQRVGEHGA